MKTFASDNWAGVHPHIMEAMAKANVEHDSPYQQDSHTERVKQKIKDLFKADVEVFFAVSGTAANVLSLAPVLSYNKGVVCPDTAHINTDEAGALERFTGCKILPVKNYDNGKLKVSDVDFYMSQKDNFHRVVPAAVSISQATEKENVYTVSELRAIGDYAKKHALYFHVDGSRCANAAVALSVSMKEMFTDTGVDILSFGGAKNGMMFGEAIVFFDKKLAVGFHGLLKQSMQIVSKSRFIAAQFDAYLTDDLWKETAEHANAMAKYLESRLRTVPGVTVTVPAVTNAVYVKMPSAMYAKVKNIYPFHQWDDGEYRLMCAFDTEREDIDRFVKILIDI